MNEERESSDALAQLRTIATQNPSPVSSESLCSFLRLQPELRDAEFDVILPNEKISAGASGGLLMFEIVAADEASAQYSGRYVLRYDLSDGAFFAQTSLCSQFELLRQVHGRGIPCAEVMWLDVEGQIADGATALIMRRVEAKAPIIQYVQAGTFVEATDEFRETMIRSLMESLVKLHQLPVRELELDLLGDRSGRDQDYLTSQVDWALHELYANFPEVEKGERAELHADIRRTLTQTAERLKRVAPKGVKPVLVHGDPTIANTMFDDHGHVVAMLDWELAHAGLAAEDVFHFVYAAKSIACLGGVAVALPTIEDVSRYYREAGGTLEHAEYGGALAAFGLTIWGCIGLRRMPKELWKAQRITWETQSGYLAAAMEQLPA